MNDYRLSDKARNEFILSVMALGYKLEVMSALGNLKRTIRQVKDRALKLAEYTKKRTCGVCGTMIEEYFECDKCSQVVCGTHITSQGIELDSIKSVCVECLKRKSDKIN